jgi:PhnB protein
MGTDVIESMGHKPVDGNNFSLSLEAESKDEADKIFNALASGGKVEMPMQNTFWGSYFGMTQDKFGIQWMMSYNEKR